MEIKTTVEKVKVVTEVEKQVNQFILNDEEIKAFYLLFGCMPIAEIERFMKRTIEHYKMTNSPICDNFNLEVSKEFLFAIFSKVANKYRGTGIIKASPF